MWPLDDQFGEHARVNFKRRCSSENIWHHHSFHSAARSYEAYPGVSRMRHPAIMPE